MITKRQLLKKLRELQHDQDPESAHKQADDLLLEYINDPLIDEEYEAIPKWYA